MPLFALMGLLQVAGAEWRLSVANDLCVMSRALKPLLDELPLPSVDPTAWQEHARQHPHQCKQLVRRSAKMEIQQHEVDFKMGVMADELGDEDLVVIPVDCPLRNRVCRNQKGLSMRCRRSRGERCKARQFVVGPVCPTCNAKVVTKKRGVDHMMRGALACMPPHGLWVLYWSSHLIWPTEMTVVFKGELVLHRVPVYSVSWDWLILVNCVFNPSRCASLLWQLTLDCSLEYPQHFHE